MEENTLTQLVELPANDLLYQWQKFNKVLFANKSFLILLPNGEFVDSFVKFYSDYVFPDVGADYSIDFKTDGTIVSDYVNHYLNSVKQKQLSYDYLFLENNNERIESISFLAVTFSNLKSLILYKCPLLTGEYQTLLSATISSLNSLAIHFAEDSNIDLSSIWSTIDTGNNLKYLHLFNCDSERINLPNVLPNLESFSFDFSLESHFSDILLDLKKSGNIQLLGLHSKCEIDIFADSYKLQPLKSVRTLQIHKGIIRPYTFALALQLFPNVEQLLIAPEVKLSCPNEAAYCAICPIEMRKIVLTFPRLRSPNIEPLNKLENDIYANMERTHLRNNWKSMDTENGSNDTEVSSIASATTSDPIVTSEQQVNNTMKDTEISSSMYQEPINTQMNYINNEIGDDAQPCERDEYRGKVEGIKQEELVVQTPIPDSVSSQKDMEMVEKAKEAMSSTHNIVIGKESSIVCSMCFKGFARKVNLNSHIRLAHPKVIFICQDTQCDRSFKTNANRQRHMEAAHSGKRPLASDQCESRSSTEASLKRLKKSHTVSGSSPNDRSTATTGDYVVSLRRSKRNILWINP